MMHYALIIIGILTIEMSVVGALTGIFYMIDRKFY